MSASEAVGRVVGSVLGAVVLLVARPVVWFVHRPTTRGEEE